MTVYLGALFMENVPHVTEKGKFGYGGIVTKTVW